MPLPMVHLETAHAAAEGLRIGNLPAFYLGSIAPDGVHMRENPEPDAKIRSHLGTRRPDDLSPVAEFLQRYREAECPDYYLGYAVHVLTDAWWNELVYGPYTKCYEADPSPVQERSQAYYNDTDQIDLLLYRTFPRREEIWALLEQARGQDVGDILSAREAELWNRRTLAWYGCPRQDYLPVRYFSEQGVREFIREAAKRSAAFVEQARTN